MLRLRLHWLLVLALVVGCSDTPPTATNTVPASVEGVVAEPDGTPVPGVAVSAHMEGWAQPLGQVETGEDGSYSMSFSVTETRVPDEVTIRVAREGFSGHEGTVSFEEGVSHDVEIEFVGSEATIGGTVQDESSGDPIEGAAVTGYDLTDGGEWQTFSATTDGDGEFEALFRSPGEAESLMVVVQAEGYVTGRSPLAFEEEMTFDSELVLQHFAGGEGTEARPFEIETVEHLEAIEEDLGAHYVQVADIDATEAEDFTPVGEFVDVDTAEETAFSGHYDGDGHAIEGLSIERAGSEDVGIFGAAYNALIENVHLVDVDVVGDTRVGALAGRVDGESVVRASEVSGEVLAEATLAGGLAGSVSGASLIGGVHADVEVNSNGAVAGGLVGLLEDSAGIQSSTSTGSVSSEDGTVGGLAGELLGSTTVEGSSSDAAVTTDGDVAGGLVGDADGSVTITRSFSHGQVAGSGTVGGLVGGTSGAAEIAHSYVSASVEGEQEVGGLAGVLNGTLEDSYVLGSVTEVESTAGGLAGTVGPEGEIEGAFASVDLDADSNYGGAVGTMSGSASRVYFNEEAAGTTAGTGTGIDDGMTALEPEAMEGEEAEANMDLLFGPLWTPTATYPILWWQ